MKTKLEYLQEICKKYNLNSDGLKKELYDRINEFKETYVVNSETLIELREKCKSLGLFYTGNKDFLEKRIAHFQECGENKRNFDEANVIEVEDALENVDLSKDEIEDILRKLKGYTYDELIYVCKKYKLVQSGKVVDLQARVKLYLESGTIDSERRKDVYQFDKDGNIIKHYKTITECEKEVNIGKNIIASAIDKKYVVNGYIFRSGNVKFSEVELVEINNDTRIAKRQLTKDDHAEIKEKYNANKTTDMFTAIYFKMGQQKLHQIISFKSIYTF